MSDEPHDHPDPDPVPDPAPPPPADDDRIGKLEDKVDRILGMLAGQPDIPETRPDGGSVGLEIRQQLDERDRQRAAAEKAKADGDRLGALETRVSELAEKPPGPLPRRVEKIMGWS